VQTGTTFNQGKKVEDALGITAGTRARDTPLVCSGYGNSSAYTDQKLPNQKYATPATEIIKRINNSDFTPAVGDTRYFLAYYGTGNKWWAKIVNRDSLVNNWGENAGKGSCISNNFGTDNNNYNCYYRHLSGEFIANPALTKGSAAGLLGP